MCPCRFVPVSKGPYVIRDTVAPIVQRDVPKEKMHAAMKDYMAPIGVTREWLVNPS